MTRLSVPLILVAMLGCGEDTHIDHLSAADADGDGVANRNDCAPYNPEISGNIDGDPWYDLRCRERVEAGESGYFLLVEPGSYADCDDHDANVHPGGTPETGPEPWELAPELDVVTHAPVCTDGIPDWAYDGVDNDCDTSVDVPDFDRDGWVDQESGGLDCDSCQYEVNPGIDEREVTADGCPLYAYDGIDNDCGFATESPEDDGDVVDLDGDGHEGTDGAPSTVGVTARWAEGCDAVLNRTLAWTGADVASLADGPDCDEAAPTIYPDAPEFCDDTDQDCDGDPLNGFTPSEDGERLVLHVDAATTSAPEAQTGRSAEEALPSVQAAVRYLATCSELHLAPGVYAESVEIDAVALLTEDDPYDPDFSALSVRVLGTGPGVRLEGTTGYSLEVGLGPLQSFYLEQVTLAGAGEGLGGVDVEGGTLDARALTVEGVGAVGGAALEHTAGVASVVDDAAFDGNTGAGALLLRSQSILIADSTFSANTSEGSGGAATLEGFRLATVRDVRLTGNTAGNSGGGIAAIGGALTLDGLTVETNSGGNNGGGIYAVAATIDASQLIFTDNRATIGAGAYLSAGDLLTVVDSTFSSNIAADAGGGLYAAGNEVAGDGLSFTGNEATRVSGGGLYSLAGIGTFSNFTVEANTAGDSGAGVYAIGDDLSISTVVSSFNLADGAGGGLYLAADDLALADLSSTSDGALNGSALYAVATGVLSPASIRSVGVTDARGTGVGGALAIAFVESGSVSDVNIACGPTTARLGTAAVVQGGNVVVEQVTTTGCTAVEDGGALYLGPITELAAADLHVTDASAGGSGGAIYVDARDAVLEKVSLERSSAGGDGGAVFVNGDDLVLSGISVTTATAGGDGGAVYTNADQIELVDLTVTGAAAGGDGGALYAHGDDVSISAVSTDDTRADDDGGAIFASGDTLAIADVTATAASAVDDGGGLLADGSDVTLASLVLTGGTAGDDGGGAFIGARTLLAASVIASGNDASGDGGGLYVDAATVTMSALTIDTNTAGGRTGGSGGGVAVVGGSCTIEDTTVTDNTAAGDGGGIDVAGRADVSLLDVEVSGNTATGDGGGAHLLGDTVTVDGGAGRTLFAENLAPTGWGGNVYLQGATLVSLRALDVEGDGITPNAEYGGGAAVYRSELLDIADSTFTGSWVTERGGGVFGQDVVTVTWDGVAFEDNVAEAGGDHASVRGADVTMTDLTARSGGSGSRGSYNFYRTLDFEDSAVSLTDGVVQDNYCSINALHASVLGEALYAETLLLHNVLFTGNVCNPVVEAADTLQADQLTLTLNKGAVKADKAYIDNSVVTGNEVQAGFVIWVSTGTFSCDFFAGNERPGYFYFGWHPGVPAEPFSDETPVTSNVCVGEDDTITLDSTTFAASGQPAACACATGYVP